MRIYPVLVPDFLTNSYLVAGDDGEAVLIDPGKAAPELISIIENNRLKMKGALLTSSSPEHSGGVGTLGKIYDFPVYSFNTGLRDGDSVSYGMLSFQVIETPGHSLDALSYLVNSSVLFSGDSLLAGTLAPTESYMQKALLVKSVREKLLTLPDEVFLYPGRGPLSRLGLEKMFNLDLLETEASFPSA